MADSKRRKRAQELLEKHHDEGYLTQCLMYGVPISEMTETEVRGALCYALKNPKVISQMTPIHTG